MKPAPSKKPKPQQEVVVQIPFSELHPFPDHPFQVREDACISDDLESLDRERVTNATAKLGALAETHSFFRVLYAKWFYLHSKGFKNNGENVTCALDELRSLPEALPLYQKQIQRFFELVLDIDKAGREPSRQVMRYYHFDQPDQPSDPELFPFRLLTTRFEPVDGDTCAPVLYANTVADMISFSLQTCVERNITVRRCKNCGRYFAQTGRVSAEYCDRTPLDGQSSCRAMGAFQQWTLKQADDPVFKVYRREYKRRFAWIKAGRISDSEFYSSYIAALGEKLRRARQGMFPCQGLRSFSFLLFQSTGIPDPHSMA